jgi:putative Holliday junction resolvase
MGKELYMRILALDMGDVWVGTAISDALGITCRPFGTVKRPELMTFLKKALVEERIGMVIVGLPTTLAGKESEQTRKTLAVFDELKAAFPAIEWKMLDERLTSHQAVVHQRDVKKQRRSVESKRESHSLAAAFILKEWLATQG